MYPDYISAKMMRKLHNGQVFSPMGCRSILTDWIDPSTGEYKYEGRFNKGVVSINLPQVGLACGGDIDLFWETFDQRLELCHEALLCKADLLRGTPSSISPIHWQHGGLARLGKNETIDSLLEGGYSTISLGYIGLYELTQIIMGCSHTTAEGKEFALSVLKYMKDKCNQWNKEKNLGFGLYGTPAESLCYRFAQIDRSTYGVISGVTDKQWYTNSYHVCPTEEIDAFSKIDFESAFQEYSSGGCISYIEIPNLENNLEAVDQLVQYMYDNILYCELNTRSDFCCECNYHGEVLYDKENDEWYCPQCGCRDQKKVIPTRRTCGYLGSHHWNQGKTEEITSRVLHVD
jgi:ribonucleoside-triphosphate reductase